ncbi:uncharacterized protein NPIL_557791 [Nephila pilipes]|uniref:Uncharacterized protein n=1 Tax=Nephila pilipes TaxID=299642 RepID=A0A8X6P9Y4_NEPPI|nr:uncharacterized protein NPIL_557791 [Nephila pilipes]
MAETMKKQDSEIDNICEVVSSLQNIVSKYQTRCIDSLQLNQNLRRNCGNIIAQLHLQFLNNDSQSTLTDSNETDQSKTFESKQEQLIDLIQAATKENFELRESNVKLRRQSKFQNNKIRNLKYMISQQNKKMAQNKVDQRAILIQENIIRSKLLEIQKLKYEIKRNEQLLTNNENNIKLINKQSVKAVASRKIYTSKNNILENQKAGGDSSMISVASKLNDFLNDLNIQISEDKKNAKSCSVYDAFLTDTQTSLMKLIKGLTV